jgi:hypothetical protein
VFLEEILAEKQAPLDEISVWAAQQFGVPESAVVVERDEDRGGPLGDDIELLIEVAELGGDFPAHLSLFARSPRAERAERDSVVNGFARRFRTTVLVSDDSPDPYRIIRVTPDGSRGIVRLNAEALDGEDAYVVEGPYVPDGAERTS